MQSETGSQQLLACLQSRLSAEKCDRNVGYENGLEPEVRFFQFPADHPAYARFATIVTEDAKIVTGFDRRIKELTDRISQLEREQFMMVATPATSNLSRRQRREHFPGNCTMTVTTVVMTMSMMMPEAKWMRMPTGKVALGSVSFERNLYISMTTH